ncbi:MAG: hypothetical protein KGL39_59040 [Patescibacteria group bacterium]|nr:hypothetical protein [Patescibacteria group bacterium]
MNIVAQAWANSGEFCTSVSLLCLISGFSFVRMNLNTSTGSQIRGEAKVDWDDMENQMEEFFVADAPLTLIEVSKLLEISKEALRENRTTLSMAISARRRGWNAAAAASRGLELEEQVCGIARGSV